MDNRRMRFKNFWKKYSNYLFLIFLIAATVFVIWTQVDLREFMDTLARANLWYLGLGIVCVLIYWALEGYMLLKLLRRDKKDEGYPFAMVVTLVGQYYNLITPGSSGGQPLQLYEMSKRGYSMGSGTAVLVQKYALYQITVTIIAILATLLNLGHINASVPAAKGLIAFGLIVNVLGVVLVLILALSPAVARRILTGGIRLLNRLHIVKDVARYYDKTDRFIADYSKAIDGLKANRRETAGLFLVSAVQILVFFSINYLVYRSLGLSGSSPFLVISMQAILYVAVAFIPTPGAAGGAEAGFALIFGPIYGAVNTSVGLVVWRIITFYFIILFGGVFLAVRSALLGRKQQKREGVIK
ncbi:MAG: lysylphosphatidylglycerol synthase transmembrane domain-containing protein [Eubacterium sp.]|nr:lysylphosphatidylglycerol synthase transmembrane domain-containing protein [Eubacterium sp.]